MNVKWYRTLRMPLLEVDGGANGGTGQATGDTGAAGTPEKFVIDGVEYTPDQLKELVSKGKDYTKKTQDLSRQRQEFEQQKQEFEKLMPYKDFITALESDQNLSSQVINVVQSYRQNSAAPTQTDINVIKKAAEQTDSDETREMLEQMQLDMEITKLSAKYDDFDENAVLEYAMQEEIPDLEKAYKLLNYEKHQESAAKKVLEDAKKGSQVPRTQTGNAGAAPGTEVKKPKTWGEANQAALEYLRGGQQG